MQAARAVRKAIRNQVDGLGFSLVEIVSPCPTVWKMDPLDAQRYVREELLKVFPSRCVSRSYKGPRTTARATASARVERNPGHSRFGGRAWREPSRRQPKRRRPSCSRRRIRRTGRAAAGRDSGGSGLTGRPACLVAAFVRAGDAFRHVELPCAGDQSAGGFAHRQPSQCSVRAERALAAKIPGDGGAGWPGFLQRRCHPGGLCPAGRDLHRPPISGSRPTSWAPSAPATW